jgi:hypothetical protein
MTVILFYFISPAFPQQMTAICSSDDLGLGANFSLSIAKVLISKLYQHSPAPSAL